MDTPSYASYHGFELRAEPDAHADPIRRIKGWHPIVRDRDGRPLPDEINAPWLSQSEAEQRAVETARCAIEKLDGKRLRIGQTGSIRADLSKTHPRQFPLTPGPSPARGEGRV